MLDRLVKMADRFDQEGKQELADAIDALITTKAARPKAPLKKLDDDVKKDLMKFLTTVKKSGEESLDALEELGRRLRYFDMDDVGKELGLDKMLKDVEKVMDAMDGATDSMYSMVYGKKPSKSDMEQMADDFGLKKSDKESPLEFFEKTKSKDDVVAEEVDSDEEDESFEDEGTDEEDISDQDLRDFLGDSE